MRMRKGRLTAFAQAPAVRRSFMRRRKAASTIVACVASVVGLATVLVTAQQMGLDPAVILKPLADSWPTYSGDYTGRRYSSLTQINQSNVRHLTLAWTTRVAAGPRSGGGPPNPNQPATIIGGEGSPDIVVGGATTVKGAVLMVNGVLYVTAPDNLWALDAHDGHELWHY